MCELAVIMAGGKGTRIASVTQDVPKPMLKVCGKPILEHQIDVLKANGITNIMLVTGHLADKIKSYFEDGKKFGVNISYFEEKEPLGTAGALYLMREKLPEDFILLCGDIIFDVDFARMFDFYKRKNALALLAAHPNNHPFDSSLLVTDSGDRIIYWLSKDEPRTYYKNQVNAGIHILNKKLLQMVTQSGAKVDLDKDLLKRALESKKIFAYKTPEYIKDMGTPERYKETEEDIKSGFAAARNLSRKQRAFFLDRDGTINRPHGFVRKAEDFVLEDGAAEAIKMINRSGCLAIVITNQPVIARGEITLEELNEIHNKMESDLGKYGAYLDDIYFCPHHPDGGFEGERSEYKIECECRKPKPGMLLAAAKKYNIDLSRSFMIGDSWRDVEAGRAASCTPLLIGEGAFKNLLAAVESIIPRQNGTLLNC